MKINREKMIFDVLYRKEALMGYKSIIPCNPHTIQLHFLLMINVEWYESWPSGKEKDKSEKQGQKIRGPGADDRYISTKK